MKRINFYILAIATLIFIVNSCGKSHPEEETAQLKELIGDQIFEQIIADDLEAILVIPNGGCNGCITDAELFVSENTLSLKNRMLTIFTDVISEKNLGIRVGKNIVKSPYTIMDSDHLTSNTELIIIYPSIIYLRDNRFEKLVQVSSENPMAIETLKSYLRIK